MPTFQKCDESVATMAAAILCEFESHKPILTARVRVDYVFAFADKDDSGMAKGDAIRHRGQKALGLCRRIKLKDRVLGRADAEITLDGDWWKPITDDFSRPKIMMRKHDYEIGWFAIIAERHGKQSQEVQQAARMFEKSGQAFWPDLFGRVSITVTNSEPKHAADEALIEQCLDVIRSEQKASVSLLQRRLRLGYSAAARIMETLEDRGIVGPAKGAEPRDILIELDNLTTAPKQ